MDSTRAPPAAARMSTMSPLSPSVLTSTTPASPSLSANITSFARTWIIVDTSPRPTSSEVNTWRGVGTIINLLLTHMALIILIVTVASSWGSTTLNNLLLDDSSPPLSLPALIPDCEANTSSDEEHDDICNCEAPCGLEEVARLGVAGYLSILREHGLVAIVAVVVGDAVNGSGGGGLTRDDFDGVGVRYGGPTGLGVPRSLAPFAVPGDAVRSSNVAQDGDTDDESNHEEEVDDGDPDWHPIGARIVDESAQGPGGCNDGDDEDGNDSIGGFKVCFVVGVDEVGEDAPGYDEGDELNNSKDLPGLAVGRVFAAVIVVVVVVVVVVCHCEGWGSGEVVRFPGGRFATGRRSAMDLEDYRSFNSPSRSSR